MLGVPRKGWDDIDNCFVVRKHGWKILYDGMGAGYHYPRTTRGDNSKMGMWLNLQNGQLFYKRWGYPLRLVFALNNTGESAGLLRKACMDQNKVIVIKERSKKLPYEHTNMKVMEFSSFLFNAKALLHIMTKRSRKQQKEISFIFTDDRKFYSFAGLFKPFIAAEIVFEAAIPDLSRKASALIKEKKEKYKNSIKTV